MVFRAQIVLPSEFDRVPPRRFAGSFASTELRLLLLSRRPVPEIKSEIVTTQQT